jgi:hypothetical protein
VIAAVIGIGLVVLPIGWVLGMWTKKRSSRWCPVDGTKLTCPHCATRAVHSHGSQANLRRRSSMVDGAA